MYLKDTILENYNRFEIDSAAITLHTLDKRNIMLPYSGPLPVEFEGATNPYISMSVQPGDVRIVLFADKDGKKLHAGLEATPDEIDGILSRFFFADKGGNTYHTRFDNGLDRYWLGHYQAEYSLWRRITLESEAFRVVSKLPDDKRAGLIKFLQRMERERMESATV